ncbi:MAG: hypothetical protein JWP04_3224 [Belnapia sp.]|nr:hypothetical protein [Belnapia sp.]
MLRRILLTIVIAGIVLVVFAGRIELGPLAARLASGMLGRQVGIASLHVTPGRWLRIEVSGLSIANLPGGSRPAMLNVGKARAEVEAWSLLRGPPVIRGLELAEASLLLERTAEHGPNWRFGETRPEPGPEDRSGFPALLQGRIRQSEVVLRTTSGQILTTRIAESEIRTTAPDAPVRLTATGDYNRTPATLDATLGPIAVLRDAARPYPTDLRLTAGADATLHFQGHMTKPLDVDGATGHLTLRAPEVRTLLALAGAEASLDAPLLLEGQLERRGDLWRLTAAKGSLAGEDFTAPLLQLTEGSRGKPDDVVVDIGLSRVDLNKALARGRRDEAGHTDLPLAISAAPDPLLRASVTIGELVYAGLEATDVRFAGALTPGRITLEGLGISTSGAKVSGGAELTAAGEGARATADLVLEDGDLDRLRRAFGLRDLPLTGRLDGRVAVVTVGETVNRAVRAARISAVVAMRQGRVAREVIELASTDLRLLFRAASGTTPVSCLLGVLEMRAGAGTVAPLRIRSAEGTIAGTASFDLRQRRLDLVIGSQRESTGFFALDIPVRVAGSFADPSIRPAQWSAEGRERLAAGDAVAPLPAALRSFAQRNPCYRAG